MVDIKYIPRRGDLVWINFIPQSGHEQAGKRPAIVLSPVEYNKRTGVMIVCPVTSKENGYPFEVKVTGKKINGVVLSDQVKCLDWRVRSTVFIEKVSEETLTETKEKLLVLIG